MKQDERKEIVSSNPVFNGKAKKRASIKEALFSVKEKDEELVRNKDEPDEEIVSHKQLKTTKGLHNNDKSKFKADKSEDSKFVTDEDIAFEDARQLKKRSGKELNAAEVKQKAYFTQKLSGKKQTQTEFETEDQILNQKYIKKVSDKRRMASYHASLPVGAVKYHVDNILSYERDDEYNSDEEMAQVTSESAVSIRNNARKKDKRRYRTEHEKPRKKRNSVADMDLMIQENKNAKRFREEKKAEQAFDMTKDLADKIVSKVKEFAKRNKIFLIILVVIVIIFLSLSSFVGVLTEAFSNITSGYVAVLSPAYDTDMTSAENYFTALEAKLQEDMDNIETKKPGYDTYVVNGCDVGHDAILLMAYLSAVYEGYDLSTVQSALDSLFNDMYEVKYDVTASNGKKTLTMTVTKTDWDTLMASRITDDVKENYKMYTDFGGGHQAFKSPFAGNWSGHISSSFGWRIHPITGKEKFHNGVDIALPSGTPVKSCSTGTVVKSYYSDSAGNYVVVEDASGYQVHYMHLSNRNVSVGDIVSYDTLIGTVGSTGNSTGPHLHLGITDPSGEYLNPIFLVQGGS